MKVEAEKCLSQSERLANEKVEFESEIYDKVTSELSLSLSKEPFYLSFCGKIFQTWLIVFTLLEF